MMSRELKDYIAQLKKEIKQEEKILGLCRDLEKEAKRYETGRINFEKQQNRRRRRIAEERNNKRNFTVPIVVSLVVVIVSLLSTMLYTVNLNNKPKQETNNTPVVINIENIEKVEIIMETQEETKPQKEPEVQVIPEPPIVTPGFNYNDAVIDGWTLKEEYQQMIYKATTMYPEVPYAWALAVAYKEKSYNDPCAVNVNSNGTLDIGLMQVNTIHAKMIRKITKCEDIEEVLKKPWPNIRCAVYYMRWIILNYDITTAEEFFIAYNGGVGTLTKVRSGEYTSKCLAYKYAIDALRIISELGGKHDATSMCL